MNGASIYEPGGANMVVFSTSTLISVIDFQLYIVSYSGDTIACSQILKDTLGQAVTELAEMVLGSGIRGIIFETDYPLLEKLCEVWFLMNGYLYESKTHIDNEAWLAYTLNTLIPKRP